jgi:hypothetical protein
MTFDRTLSGFLVLVWRRKAAVGSVHIILPASSVDGVIDEGCRRAAIVDAFEVTLTDFRIRMRIGGIEGQKSNGMH